MLSFQKGPPASEWARTAEIATPVKWGEVEQQIISRRLAPGDGKHGPNWLLGVVVALPVLVLLVFILSPIIAAALVVKATTVDVRSVQSDLTLIARFLFVVSIVISGTWLRMWWQTRTRSWVAVLSGIAATLSVVVTFAVGLSYDGDLPGDGLVLLALLAGGLGLVLTIIELVSKGEGQKGVPKSARAQRRFSAAREDVVDVLVERGLVELTPDQRHRMQRMRVGTWYKFDAQGRV